MLGALSYRSVAILNLNVDARSISVWSFADAASSIITRLPILFYGMSGVCLDRRLQGIVVLVIIAKVMLYSKHSHFHRIALST
jgi:hypothetical protein